jgi:hypothetical protein
MGFLDNTTITVDAILTKVGRQKLSQGEFNIDKFALSDEEIDYNLYDVNHPNGTDSYGAVIENMNLMEAIPNRTGFMSHLIHDSLAGAQIYIQELNITNITPPTPITINPDTIGGGSATGENYTFTIGNINIVRFSSNPAAWTLQASEVTLIPQEFSNPSPNNTTTVTVTGVDSGISAIVSITVNSTQGSSDDSSGPSCFIEGTEIQMANGMKFIEDITVGDMVKSFDLKSNTIMNSKVMETFIHTPHNYMIINGIIKTTDNHPFYSNGNWIEAGDLSIGDKILHVDGLEHTIKTIELSDESVTVYNFEVDGTHNYFAEGYLVHNKQTSGTQ